MTHKVPDTKFRNKSKFIFFEWITIAGETRFFGWHTWREEYKWGEWIPIYWVDKNE